MSDKAFSLDTCSKEEFIAAMIRQGMALIAAMEAWEITRHGFSDVVEDGQYYRPDLDSATDSES